MKYIMAKNCQHTKGLTNIISVWTVWKLQVEAQPIPIHNRRYCLLLNDFPKVYYVGKLDIRYRIQRRAEHRF